MRRILAWVVTGVVLASANFAPSPGLAQQQQGDQPQTAAELVRLWERMPQIQDPAERIAESERALKLVGEVDTWPLPVARDEARARIWRWSGLGYAQWTGGQREENLERAIAAYERALQVLTREAAPRQWALTQDALGEVYRNRIRGDRADNVEKAIALHEAALTVLTREAFPQDWAFAQANLGTAYLLRIGGERAENVEKAIDFYEAALTAQTREAAPEDWALTQANLGAAHLLNFRGDRAESIEKAISAFEAALTVPLGEALPKEWADAQVNLGIAYSDRIGGDRAENQEKAIAAFEAALTVRTREATPQDWAWTQHNLALAYESRMRGNRADNLEKAIALNEAALTVRTREALPQDWAKTQHSLGVVYSMRVLGDRADNLEKSIAHFEAALTVRSRAGQPQDWAYTQQKLGLALAMRARGERADNFERAIAAFEAVLTVLSPESNPQDWAQVQSALGLAYSSRIRGKRADDVEKAIVHLQAALKVLTPEEFPGDWAAAHVNLGHAYNRRVAGSPAENVDSAIRHFELALTVLTPSTNPHAWATAKMYLGTSHSNRVGGNVQDVIAASEAALSVFNREDFPLEWAIVQSNLGSAYLDWTRGDRQAALAKAIAHFEAALAIQTRESSPRDHLRPVRLLGAALSEKGEWQRAAAAYADARQTFLLLFAQGLDDTAAGALIDDAGPLFSEAAYAAAQLGETETALALASEGRARLMAAALKLQALDLPADERRRIDALRVEIRAAERALEAQATQGAERAAAVERLVGLRQELVALVKDADAAEVKARGSALAQARAIAGKGGGVAVPVVTKLGAKILIVSKGSDPAGLTPGHNRKGGGATVSDPEGLTPGLTQIDLPQLTTAALDALLFGTGSNNGWIYGYSVNLLPDDDLRSQGWPLWMAAIDGLGPDLWKLLGARLDAGLKQAGVRTGARLVWLPTGALGILPLGLAQNPASRRRLADDYEIVYAPSLDALAAAQAWIARPAPATLAAIVNPTGDLPASEQEGRAIASHFPAKARAVLEGPAATSEAVLAALKGRSYWHFASHGLFEWKDARQSALVMHGNSRLSVGRLLETDGLGRPRLVVLSACETGLYDISRNPDEFIGLPGTFTALGAAGVLGTLWPVNDMATALLLAKFYDLHLADRLPPPTALRRAQLWLRQSTSTNLVAYARGAARQGRLDARHVAAIAEELSIEGLRRSRSRPPVEWVGPEASVQGGKRATRGAVGVARPYAHPFYWAGFIHTGL